MMAAVPPVNFVGCGKGDQVEKIFSGVSQVKNGGGLSGGFKHFLFSPLLGEMIQFD